METLVGVVETEFEVEHEVAMVVCEEEIVVLAAGYVVGY